jgi:mRNA interferase MazF
MIHQGELYWLDVGTPVGSAPGFKHPHVVIQSDALNASRLGTVVVCALTSNVRLAQAPGNVLLDRGEAGLTQASVVNVTQLYTVDKSELEERIGTLSRRRVMQVLQGVRLVIEPADVD